MHSHPASCVPLKDLGISCLLTERGLVDVAQGESEAWSVMLVGVLTRTRWLMLFLWGGGRVVDWLYLSDPHVAVRNSWRGSRLKLCWWGHELKRKCRYPIIKHHKLRNFDNVYNWKVYYCTINQQHGTLRWWMDMSKPVDTCHLWSRVLCSTPLLAFFLFRCFAGLSPPLCYPHATRRKEGCHAE